MNKPLPSLQVNEIFDSIQGEGAWTGIPVTFFRTQGCNLQCPWCDTKSSWSKAPDAGTLMSMGDVLANLRHRIPITIVLTGGEPMLQVESLTELVSRLGGRNWHLETNGTIPIPDELHRRLRWVTVSPKPPDYITNVSRCDELKVVISGEADFEAAETKARIYPGAVVCLQPRDNDPDLTAWCIEYLLTKRAQRQWWRLSMQVHKMIGVR